MSNRLVTIVETIPITKCKYCLVSVPDVGLAGAIALGYIIQDQQMEEVGSLESEAFPPVMVVHKGEIKSPFRIYNKGELSVFISEIPIDPRLIPMTARLWIIKY